MWKRIKRWLQFKLCRHEFNGWDMVLRDENGIMHWPCRKCGYVFSGEYGLQVQTYGKIVGNWGPKPDNRKDA